jgi:hypothetical protein
MNFLIKKIKIEWLKIFLRKNSPKNSQIMFQICVHDQEVQGKELVLYFENIF